MTDFALTMPARARTAATRKSRPVAAHSGAAFMGAGAVFGLMAQGIGKTFGRAARRPVRTLVQLGVLGIGGLIIINALSLQTARHPALMAARSQAPLADQVSDRPPMPPSRPAEFSATAMPTTTPANREATAAPVRALSPATPAASARNSDPIGDLLRGEGPRGEGAASGAAREPARPVIAAQRALVKLGYTQIKADGVPGEATKSAIERFERERKLPVTGQLNPRTLRELAAASGMKLD